MKLNPGLSCEGGVREGDAEEGDHFVAEAALMRVYVLPVERWAVGLHLYAKLFTELPHDSLLRRLCKLDSPAKRADTCDVAFIIRDFVRKQLALPPMKAESFELDAGRGSPCRHTGTLGARDGADKRLWRVAVRGSFCFTARICQADIIYS